MKSLIFAIGGLLVGIIMFAGSGYYLLKEKNDKEAVKIYGTFAAIGAVITIGMVIKMITQA